MCKNFQVVFVCELQRKSKISSSRRLGLKIRLLAVATQMLQDEKEQKMRERELTLTERLPPLNLSGLSLQQLQNLYKELHQKIDILDEERYDIGLKVSKNENEVSSLKITC
uniref:Uncharacterized protein n=1 Tax=Oryzias sinensis TaxID=183150 RepID=A0A8C7YUF5_9TELE